MSAHADHGDAGPITYMLELRADATGYRAELRAITADGTLPPQSPAMIGRGSAATAPAAILAAAIDAQIPAIGTLPR